MIIAIDGPAGSGKTTTAKSVASYFGYLHINTGAMYRGVALKFIEYGISIHSYSEVELKKILDDIVFELTGEDGSILFMNGHDVSSEIKSHEVTNIVSSVSSIEIVREKMVNYQRKMSLKKDVVLEGRDIGSVVFPNADFKFFLVADLDVRAIRRKKQIEMDGENVSLDFIISSLKERDEKDSMRSHSPLIKTKDAIELDTTHLTIENQINFIINKVNQNNKEHGS